MRLILGTILGLTLFSSSGFCAEKESAPPAESVVPLSFNNTNHRNAFRHVFELGFLTSHDVNILATASRGVRQHLLSNEEHKRRELIEIFSRIITKQEGNPFISMDHTIAPIVQRVIPEWRDTLGGIGISIIRSALKEALGTVEKGGILAIKGSGFPFAALSASAAPAISSASAGAGSGDASEDSGVGESKAAAAVAEEMSFASAGAGAGSAEGSSVDASNGIVAAYMDALFGRNNIVRTYATKGYTFWAREVIKEELGKTAENQQARRIQFQQMLGARYVFENEIVYETEAQDTVILTPATGAEAVLNDLTPHVVLTEENLCVDVIRTRVEAFFSAKNREARGDTDIPAAETPEQRNARIQLEGQNVDAVAVFDVAARERDVLTLESSYILNSIRRLIATTTSENARTIGDHFFSASRDLVFFSSKGFEKVNRIGTHFLAGCTNLVSFSLKDFENLNSIGSFALANCRSLASFSREGFEKINSIRGGFLAYCGHLGILYKINAQVVAPKPTDAETFAEKLKSYIQTLPPTTLAVETTFASAGAGSGASA